MEKAAPSHKRPSLLAFYLLTAACTLEYAGCGRSVQPAAIQVGDRKEGVLRQSERIRSEMPRGPEARWFFSGDKGQTYTILAESYEFDVYLLLMNSEGRQIGWANGNGMLFGARIVTKLPAAGRYTVVVCGATADQYGAYWLTVERGRSDVDWSPSAAMTYYQRGIAWGERNSSLRAASWMSLELGRILAMHGDWGEAEKYYNESFSTAEKGKIAVCVWAATLERGRLFARRRRYDDAVEQLHRALELSKNLRSRLEAETATQIELGSVNPLGASNGVTRTYYYQAATANADEYALPSTRVALYTALSDFLQRQDKERAIQYAEKAFALRTGVEPLLQLRAAYALASTYVGLGPDKSDEGIRIAEEMEERARQVGCPDEEVAALTLLSIAKYSRGDVDGEIEFAAKAIALTDPSDDDPSPRRIALQLKADGERMRQDYSAALQSCQAALQPVERAWAREPNEDSRRELLSESNAICTQIIENLYALNAEHPNTEYARQAFDYAERSRSRSLLEQLFTGQSKDRGVMDPSMLSRDEELLDRLSAVRGQIAALRSSSDPSSKELHHLQEERANVIAERMSLRAEIGAEVGSAYSAAHMSPLDADQAHKMLSARYPKSAILHYQLGPQESFLIVLTSSRCQMFKLPDWTRISKAVSEWRAAISGLQDSADPDGENLETYVQSAGNLYGMLVKPAEPLIRGRDLIVVPSAALCKLAFEALVVSDPSVRRKSRQVRYLIQDHAVSYTPSVSVLAEIDSRPEGTATGNRMLLLGDASSGPSAPGIAMRGEGAAGNQALPGAREEVLQIAELAARHGLRTTIWLGPQANEARFKSADLSSYRYIHIATHGISDHQDGEASALTLSPDSNGQDDGYLTSEEVSKLKFDADLVVLSGCETSIGEETGPEGVVGFNRTFLLAGARCVCGSLWQVDDSSTERLMTAFYRGFIANLRDKAQSLRLAKLAMLKHGANPSQWAPFILEGSYR